MNFCGVFHADRMSCQIFAIRVIIQISRVLQLGRQISFHCNWRPVQNSETGFGRRQYICATATSVCRLLVNPLQFYFVFFMSNICLPLSPTCKCFVSRSSQSEVKYVYSVRSSAANWCMPPVFCEMSRQILRTGSVGYVDTFLDDGPVTTTSVKILNSSVGLAKHVKKVSLFV